MRRLVEESLLDDKVGAPETKVVLPYMNNSRCTLTKEDKNDTRGAADAPNGVNTKFNVAVNAVALRRHDR